MRFLITIPFLLGSMLAVAQSQWSLGLQVAPIVSYATGSGDLKPDVYKLVSMLSGSGGLLVQYLINEKVSVESGIGLTGIGFRNQTRHYALSGAVSSLGNNLVHSYFRLPVYLKYRLGPFLKSRHIQSYILAGPTLLFRTEQGYSGGRMSYTGSSGQNVVLMVQSAIQPFFRLGVNAAVGLERQRPGGDAVRAQLIGQLGFTSLVAANWNYTSNSDNYTGKLANQGHFLGIALSYWFRPFGYNRSIEP